VAPLAIASLAVASACGGGGDSGGATTTVPTAQTTIPQETATEEATTPDVSLGPAEEADLDSGIICLAPEGTVDPYNALPDCPHEGRYTCAPPYEGESRHPRDPCNFAPYIGPVDEGGLVPEDSLPDE
jgi:hypothetical protein